MKKWQIGLIGVLSVAAILMSASLIVSAIKEGDIEETNDPLLAVYEERVNSLEGEIERLKAEQYLIKENYENKITALEQVVEASKKDTEKEKEPIAPKEPEAEKSDVVYTYTVNDGEITLSGRRGESEKLYIPKLIDGLPVSNIGREAFKSAISTEIIIPEGVGKIDWFAFSNCENLKYVRIPKSVTKIEYGAFNGTEGVTIICYKDSYAYKYAKSYGYNIQTVE